MAHKYHEHTLQGEHAQADVHKALGTALGDGVIVRTHTEGGTTKVYVAGGSGKGAEGATVREVSEADVTRIG
jgi:hypothetical protein